jgi:hypothetical protein
MSDAAHVLGLARSEPELELVRAKLGLRHREARMLLLVLLRRSRRVKQVEEVPDEIVRVVAVGRQNRFDLRHHGERLAVLASIRNAIAPRRDVVAVRTPR